MKGLDVSFSKVPAGWCASRVAEGYEVFVQCLWTGGYQNNAGLRQVAENNLRLAREAGMQLAGYINTNPWFTVSTGLQEAKQNAGAEWVNIPIIFNDVEIAGVTEQQIKDHCLGIEAAGLRTAIYSANWFWQQLGNPKWAWLKAYDIWVADYDGDPNFATAKLFGPWNLSDVIGKQYQNTTNLGGVAVDINNFADEFFKEDDVALSERQSKALDELAKLTLDPYTITIDDGTTRTFPSKMQFLMDHTTAWDVWRGTWLSRDK